MVVIREVRVSFFGWCHVFWWLVLCKAYDFINSYVFCNAYYFINAYIFSNAYVFCKGKDLINAYVFFFANVSIVQKNFEEKNSISNWIFLLRSKKNQLRSWNFFKINNIWDTILFLGQIDYEEFKKHGSENIGPSLKAQWP